MPACIINAFDHEMDKVQYTLYMDWPSFTFMCHLTGLKLKGACQPVKVPYGYLHILVKASI